MSDLGTKEWITENDKRSAYLDRLYDLDDRGNPAHPQHHTYTGLYQNRQRVLMEVDRMEQLK